METEGRDQEHQACHDETRDDRMTFEKTQTRMRKSFLSHRCDVGKWCATVTCAKTQEKCASVARVRGVLSSSFTRF